MVLEEGRRHCKGNERREDEGSVRRIFKFY